MQQKFRNIRCRTALILLGTGCILFLCCNLLYGSVSIPFHAFWHFFTGRGIAETYRTILIEIRFPRAVSALWLGGALALSGYLLQTFFHNPIAGPFVLGISSGSKLIVAITMVFFLGKSIPVSSTALILSAFAGALLSMGFVLLLSKRVNNMSMLVIGGVMIGYICSAVTDFIVTFADDSDIVNLHNWSRGSFSGMAWDNVIHMSVIISITYVIIFFLSKPIGAYQLGESDAVSMGVNVCVLRVLLILFSSILSACVVAYAGPISFVGIAVPHLVKTLLGTSKPILMIPACFLGGGAFCLACDWIARTVFAPTELSISTVTAVFGAPIVLWIMTKRKREVF